MLWDPTIAQRDPKKLFPAQALMQGAAFAKSVGDEGRASNYSAAASTLSNLAGLSTRVAECQFRSEDVRASGVEAASCRPTSTRLATSSSPPTAARTAFWPPRLREKLQSLRRTSLLSGNLEGHSSDRGVQCGRHG